MTFELRSFPIIAVVFTILLCIGGYTVTALEDSPKLIENPTPITTLISGVTDVKYQLIEYSTDVFTLIKQHLGLEPLEYSEYAVVYNGDILGVIPKDSKFYGIPLGGTCLDYQYGTNNWYQCERAYEGI